MPHAGYRTGHARARALTAARGGPARRRAHTHLSTTTTRARARPARAGGLLGAFELSRGRGGADVGAGDGVLLERASALGGALLPAFASATGLPYGTVSLRTGAAHNPAWAGGASTSAEVATLQLEFGALARHAREPRFAEAADRVIEHLATMERPPGLPPGLYPLFIHPDTGKFTTTGLTLGARADSLYEYLLKSWLLRAPAGGEAAGTALRLYLASVRGLSAHLLRTSAAGRVYFGQWDYQTHTFKEEMVRE